MTQPATLALLRYSLILSARAVVFPVSTTRRLQ